MAVKTYKRCAPVQLSEHFNSNEFRCGLGRGCTCADTLIDEQLVVWLEKIRAHFGGRKLTITSAYRCPTYNSATSGAATKSRHMLGQAVDFVISGITPREIAAYCESIGIKGIGLYETSADGRFVHIDTRTTKYFWYGQSQASRTTFGGTSVNKDTNTGNSVGSTTTGGTAVKPSSARVLRRGCTGEDVKKLQEDLIALNYDCGPRGADGKFGEKTELAVIKFQRENNLDDDGKAGPLTLAAIEKKRTGVFTAGDNVVVTASLLNIREGVGTKTRIVGTAKKGTQFTLDEVKDGWGKLKERTGWVSLQYCKKQ